MAHHLTADLKEKLTWKAAPVDYDLRGLTLVALMDLTLTSATLLTACGFFGKERDKIAWQTTVLGQTQEMRTSGLECMGDADGG